MIGANGALGAIACIAIVAGMSGLAFQLAAKPAVDRPTLGNRGLKRARALSAGGLFALGEPVVRYTAAWFTTLSLSALRPKLRRVLVRSGDHLGLSEDELLALSLLSGAGLGAATLLLGIWVDLPVASVAVALVLGGLAPWFRLATVAKHRAKRVTRSLPGVIELGAMCMGAGLDFPGSLHRIVDSAADPSEPIIEEIQRVLQELDLGRTRRSAMIAFSNRVPSDDVRELVNSVVQAEDKGSPLAQVLTIQAQTLRLRRSIAAEETASEAALMLVGPMTLIFLCVIVLLLGPVIVRFMTGGLGSA
jgi:tight adherence protein C